MMENTINPIERKPRKCLVKRPPARGIMVITNIMPILMLCWLTINPITASAISGRFSVEGAPMFSINKIYGSYGKETIFNDNGPAVGMHFGIAYHCPLQTHSSISIGLSYALGHMGLKDTQSKAPLPSVEYSLHSLWIPILCRLYTSEIRIDTSICFKVGIIPSINLSKRLISTSTSISMEKYPMEIRPIHCLMLLGSGIKYDFSLTNSLVIGLSYCGDIAGIMYKKGPNHTQIYGHNSFICLDFCLLF